MRTILIPALILVAALPSMADDDYRPRKHRSHGRYAYYHGYPSRPKPHPEWRHHHRRPAYDPWVEPYGVVVYPPPVIHVEPRPLPLPPPPPPSVRFHITFGF